MPLLITRLERFDSIIEAALHAGRIPGAAVAVVMGEETVFARGYGWRDAEAHLLVTNSTVYPIASTTKALNATLIGMLVDEGRLNWDVPIQHYLPQFRLHDAMTSSQVTLRDLLAMRTGLPRHDFLWMAQQISRSELVSRMVHLPMSAGFRERFQYNNLTPTIAGHIAEIVTGSSWEELVQQRLLNPLGMSNTTFDMPRAGETTRSYHDGDNGHLLPTGRPAARARAFGPAGSLIHSTVDDMARWIALNLNAGQIAGCRLIRPIHCRTFTLPQWLPARIPPHHLLMPHMHSAGSLTSTMADDACLIPVSSTMCTAA